VTTTDTSTSFSSRQVPWMKVGAVIDGDVTAAEAARLGGLDFDVVLRPAGFNLGTPSKPKWRVAKDRFAIVREDTDEVFNYTTKTYEPIQYREAFDFMDAINTRYVAAGSFQGGKQGFIVTQLPERTVIDLDLNGEADSLELFAVLRTSQNLSRGIEVALLTLRNRCMNELTLPSLTRGAKQTWAIRHTKNAKLKLAEAQHTLANADAYVEEVVSQAERLAKIELELDAARELVKTVLPDRPKREQQVNAILDAWQHAPTVGFAGTGWGLTNAVSEYFEWQRPLANTSTDASRFTNALDGSTHKYVARTAQLVLRHG
jgi:phage/plasmid-like protein (TIGR03299 family)